MELRDYLRTLRKGWPVVLAFVVLGAALGVGLTLATTKQYRATAQIFVATSFSASDAASSPQQSNLFTTQRVQSYVDIANSPRVTNPVIEAHPNLNLSNRELAAKITADAPQDKVLINLHVTDHDPRKAANLTRYVADQFNSAVAKLEATNSGANVKLTTVKDPTIPSAPIKPNKVLNIGFGVLLGLLVGIAVVIVRDLLDNTIKGPEDVEAVGLPALGLVPFDKRTQKSPIAFRVDPHGPRSEAYRQLRTNLQFINIDNSPRVIAVTSAVPGEGKTTTAINLAAALAEGGYRVCLVEADLRRPNIAQKLGLVSDIGFTTVLIGKASVEDVLQNAGRNLAVLTCGAVPPNPSELLITDQANAVIRQIAATADYTIVDTAPLLPVADGAEVAAMADATLLVHHAGKSTREQMARSVEALAKVGERPVGVILNMLVRNRGNYDYGYYYTYRPERGRRSDAPSDKATVVESAEVPADDAIPSGQPHRSPSPGSSNGAPAPTPVAKVRPITSQSFAPESPVASLNADEPRDWFSDISQPDVSAANGTADATLYSANGEHDAGLSDSGLSDNGLSESRTPGANGRDASGFDDSDYPPSDYAPSDYAPADYAPADQLDSDYSDPDHPAAEHFGADYDASHAAGNGSHAASHDTSEFATTELDTSPFRSDLDESVNDDESDYEMSRAERWRELRARRSRR